MEELIARLEKATGPDRELDVLIGAAVDVDCGPWIDKPFGRWVEEFGVADIAKQAESNRSILKTELPRYTASLDAAATLVPAHHEWLLGSRKPHASVWDDRARGIPRIEDGGNGATPAIALCIAALKARQTVPA